MRQREAAIRAERTQTPQQRAAQLSALVAEANKKVSDLLTPAGVNDYKETSSGGWLTNFEDDAPPAGR